VEVNMTTNQPPAYQLEYASRRLRVVPFETCPADFVSVDIRRANYADEPKGFKYASVSLNRDEVAELHKALGEWLKPA
jgi:hypothetical protein